MPATSEQLWDAIYRLGTDDEVETIGADVIAKLIEFKMAALDSAGLPQLTPYGEKCFVVMESDDGQVPELNDLASMEDQARRQVWTIKELIERAAG